MRKKEKKAKRKKELELIAKEPIEEEIKNQEELEPTVISNSEQPNIDTIEDTEISDDEFFNFDDSDEEEMITTEANEIAAKEFFDDENNNLEENLGDVLDEPLEEDFDVLENHEDIDAEDDIINNYSDEIEDDSLDELDDNENSNEEMESSAQEKRKKERKDLKQIWQNNVNFKSVGKKLLILLAIVFIFIFITTKFSQNSEKKVFEKNFETVKNASYQYFKENNRPSVSNIENIITLEELIDSGYVEPIKDKKGNLCDKENSNISIEKKSATKYDLTILLNCNSKTKTETYTLTYAASADVGSSSAELRKVYYKLKKGVSIDNYEYTCPKGYVLQGKHCYTQSTVLTAIPTEKYKTTSEKRINASYKKEEDTYEYVDPIVTAGETTYSCPSNATLVGTECIRERDYTIKYVCPSGYSKSSSNQCYYKTQANQGWNDWEYIETNTYSRKKSSTDTRLYKLIKEDSDQKKYTYEYYTRSKKYTCDSKSGENIEQKGSRCYHYISATENKKCTSGYVLNEDQTKCIKTTTARKKEDKTIYSCPTGYQKRGSGENTQCYKKVPSEGYYYCKNSNYYLDGEQCVQSAKTEFLGYKCPSGYDYVDNQCVKISDGEKISATKTNNPELTPTYKWSDKKEENGWIWTGETKEI